MIKNCKTIYEDIENEYFKESDVECPNFFSIKLKIEYDVYHFLPVDAKYIYIYIWS